MIPTLSEFGKRGAVQGWFDKYCVISSLYDTLVTMQEFKFLHCADLHIDSPFKGLSDVNTALRDILYESTFRSFLNIIDFAINERVDCVLISGDIYDGADKSLRAQLRFRDGLQKLADADIPTFVIHGNHDPLDSWSATLKWPDAVTIFGGEKVENYPLLKDGKIIARIYGISYPTRDVYKNLALEFECIDENIPSIALLHTNVGQNTGHEAYAPASIEDITSRRMNYWALGHVHNHQILQHEHPAIVYPGNSQARNPREIGEKGCCLVTLSNGGECNIDFVPTDIVRYKTDNLDISGIVDINDLIEAIKRKCEEIAEQMDKRHAIIRLILTGRTNIHSELHKENSIEDLVTSIREHFEGIEPIIWLEIKLNTSGTYDLDMLREGNDFIADIITLYDQLNEQESNNWEEIKEELTILFSSWAGARKHLEQLSQEELLEIAKEARNWSLDKLIQND